MKDFAHSLNVPIGPIHLVISDKAVQKLHEKQIRYPYLPEPEAMLYELQEMSRLGGISAIVNRRKDGTEVLHLYTSTYYLALYESNQHDGYVIGHLDSLNLQEHERMSKGTLRLRAPGWSLHSHVREIPPGNSNHWNTISSAWHYLIRLQQQAAPQETQDALTSVQEHYLDMVEDLIEVTHQLEQEKNSLNAGIPYRKVESAGEARDAPRDIYIFRLTDFPQVNEKSMLRLKDAPDLRGRVLELEGLKLTLKFEALVDRKRIPEQGILEPIASPLIYHKQREAVEMLRTREAKNAHLLHVLVDHAYLPYQPASIQQHNDRDLGILTYEQFEAFRRALTVPDMLMVLGPPGTGKTRTITEIARYCGFKKQRVLMTSGTHKAVDNVLERMPPDLIVIRVGHESNVSEKMRPKMIDAQAQKMQEVLLQNTEKQALSLNDLLTSKNAIDAMAHQLIQGHPFLVHTETRLQALSQQQNIVEARITEPFRKRNNELTASLQQLNAKVSRVKKRSVAWDRRRTNTEVRCQIPILGWLFKLLLTFATSRMQKAQAILQEKQTEIQVIQQEQAEEYMNSQRALLANVDYQAGMHSLQLLSVEYNSRWQQLLKSAQALQARTRHIMPKQPALEPKGSATLQRYLTWFNQTRARLEQRATLLNDWRGELSKPTDQLYPELLRYADVVGATCIGAATAKGLESIDFDLAIVDEAGQICLADLLVPLVRAKRAVLVGDHNQLPPFVDSDVHNWLKNLSPQSDLAENEGEMQQIADLLTKSAFEQLFTTQVPPDHMIRFTMQGRMPQIIADFASRHFYANQLGTFRADKMGHTFDTDDSDPLFSHPLTIINTIDAPSNIKWEKQQRTLESLGETGYTNIAEARLIAALAAAYQQRGKEWVVIVPYRAQASLIIKELRQQIEAHDFALEERVATVDSFQGGERHKVIYGFTRSNDRGKIGFLKELRRLNVAMTRTQQHLILVGNFATLPYSEDARFNSVVGDLYAYTQQHGQILTYEACRHKLRNPLERKTVR